MSNAFQFHDGYIMVAGPSSRTAPVVTLDTPVEDALCLMDQKGRRELLVVTAAGTLAGVVTEQELLTQIHPAPDCGELRRTRTVETVLVNRLYGPESFGASLPCQVAAGEELRCVPVLQDGQLVSVVTPDDFFVSWKYVAPTVTAASMDQLTELANRATFMRRLREEWDRTSRSKSPLALLLVDLDDFKQVNDCCGHQAGDLVLSQVGACLRGQLRSYDIVARLGGDEFAALCCDCQPDDVIAPIERLFAAVRSLSVPAHLNQDSLTLSVGAAVVQSGFESLSIEALYEAADEALYAAKRAGRDCAYRTVFDGNQASARQPVRLDSAIINIF